MSDQLDVAYWREQVAKEPSIIGAGLVASLDEILRLRAERDALLPVVEAARAWVHCRPPQVLQEFHDALVAAVDALDQKAPETALSATQSAEESAGVVGDVGGTRGATGHTQGAAMGELDLTEAIEAALRSGDNLLARPGQRLRDAEAIEAAVRATVPIIERAVRGEAEEIWQVVYVAASGTERVWSECRDAEDAAESLRRARRSWPNAGIRMCRTWRTEWESIYV